MTPFGRFIEGGILPLVYRRGQLLFFFFAHMLKPEIFAINFCKPPPKIDIFRKEETMENKILVAAIFYVV